MFFLGTKYNNKEENALVAHFLESGSTPTKLYINTVIYIITNIKVSGISDYGVEPISLGESLCLIAQR